MKNRLFKSMRKALARPAESFRQDSRNANAPMRIFGNNNTSSSSRKFWYVNVIHCVYLSIFLALFIIALPARAEESRTVHLKVAALDQVLYDNDFTVTACPDIASSTTLTVNAWCAVN